MLRFEITKIQTFFFRGNSLFGGVLLVALLAGPPPAQAEWLLRVGSGLYWVQPAAVRGTVDQFLGRPPGGGEDTGGGGGGKGSVDANGPLQLQHHLALALGWRGAHRLRPRLDLVGALRFEYARTRWFVADGIDVLRDDLTADIHHLALTPTLALRRQVPLGRGWRGDVAAGVGADVVWTRTRISSALLDVRRRDRFAQGFAFAQVGLGHERLPAGRGVVDLEWRPHDAFGLRLGLEHRF